VNAMAASIYYETRINTQEYADIHVFHIVISTLFCLRTSTDYDRWRKEAKIEVVEKTKLKADMIGIDERTKCTLITTPKSLFNDDPTIWPLHFSFHYLGQIPSPDSLKTGPKCLKLN
jgi:hypothetical protein